MILLRSPTQRAGLYRIGQVVKHRFFPFRGVIFDVDPTFNNTEEWWLSIPEDVRPRKDQPYYHVLAEDVVNLQSYVGRLRKGESDFRSRVEGVRIILSEFKLAGRFGQLCRRATALAVKALDVSGRVVDIAPQ